MYGARSSFHHIFRRGISTNPFRRAGGKPALLLGILGASGYVMAKANEALVYIDERLRPLREFGSSIAEQFGRFFEQPSREGYVEVATDMHQQEHGIFCDSHMTVDDGSLLDAFIKEMLSIRNNLIGLGIDPMQIPIPTIVVVGAQSSGKSTVLEHIIGHQCLPK